MDSLVTMDSLVSYNGGMLDVHWKDFNSLRDSVRKHDIDAVTQLVKKGVRLNIQCPIRCYSPLHLAVIARSPEIMRILLDGGADTGAKDINGDTPLTLAAKTEKKYLIDVLLSYHHGNEENEDRLGHLHVACMMNRVDIIKKLIMSDDSECNFINMSVCERSMFWPGYTPLHFAVRYDCTESVEYLLRCGADITAHDPQGFTPLHIADFQRNETLIDLLLGADEFVMTKSHGSEIRSAESHFHIACTRDNVPVVKRFLESGVDINLKSDDRVFLRLGNFKPIYFAMYYGCSKVIKFLLEAGACLQGYQFPYLLNHMFMEKSDGYDAFIHRKHAFIPSQRYPTEMTALHLACLDYKTFDSLRKSIDISIDFNALNASGSTPLHVAARHGSIDAAHFFLDNGADIFIKDLRGDTPIHIAFKYSHMEVFHSMLNKMANHTNHIKNLSNEEGLSVFHMLCTTGRLDAIESFLQAGVDINIQVSSDSMCWAGFAAIHFAWLFRQLRVVALLLMYKADASITSGIALSPSDMLRINFDLCTLNELYEAFKCLISIWASSPDKMSFLKISPLHAFCVNKIEDLEEMRQYLTSHSDEINDILYMPESNFYHKSTPLHLAMIFKNFRQAKLLLENGADPFVLNGEKKTPLECMYYCHVPLDVALTKAEMCSVHENLFTIGRLMSSPSHFRIACSFGQTSAIEWVLANIPDEEMRVSFVNQVDQQGQTPLHLALKPRYHRSNVDEIVRLLLANGANVNARDSELRTPLHHAYGGHRANTAQLLISHGANINAQDIYGKTSLHIILDNVMGWVTDKELLCSLLENGADINLTDESNQTCLNFVKLNNLGADEHEDAEQIVKHFLEHIKKSELIGRYISIENLKVYYELSDELSDNEELFSEADFIDKCERELQSMKNETIHHSITLRDILSETLDMMTIFDNPHLRRIVESEDFSERFPIYGYLIKLEIKYGQSRRSLVNECVNPLMNLIGMPIPHTCLVPILRCLSDKDLEIIKSAERVT